jgi:hypothetical protein
VDILVFSFIKKRDAAMAILVMWAISNSRNKYAHGKIVYQPRKAIDVPNNDVPKHAQKHKWKPLESGFVKINTDGAVDCHRGVSGAGIVVRDNQGLLLASNGSAG